MAIGILFDQYIFKSFGLFLFLNLLSFLVHSFIYRKYVKSIFNPMFLYLILVSSSSLAVVTFMFIRGLINVYYFSNFILTELAFVLGFFTIKVRSIMRIELEQKGLSFYANFMKHLYFISTLAFLLSQILVYVFRGIPLTYQSRWEVFYQSGGFGLLSRILDVTMPTSVFLLLWRIFLVRERTLSGIVYDMLIFFFVILSSVLSGSKMTFLNVVFISYYFALFFNQFNFKEYLVWLKKIFSRLQWLLLIFASIAAMVVIGYQLRVFYNNLSLNNILVALFARYVKFGDIYILSYPNDILKILPKSNGFLALFQDILGFFRIINWDQLPSSLGLQIYQTIYHTNAVTGPTSIYNVFGLFYFGYIGSIVYSYIVGLFIGFIVKKLIFVMKKNMFGGLLFTLFSINSWTLILNASVCVKNFFDILLFLPPLLLISLLMSSFDKDFALKTVLNRGTK